MPNFKKIFVFVITNIAFQVLVGHFGIYSIIKPSLSSEFGYDESTLGIFQFVQTLGDIIGSLFILFLSVTPSKGYLIYAVFNAIFGLILFLPQYMENKFFRDFTIYTCFFFQDFFIASLAYTQIIFSKEFASSQKIVHTIWYSLLFFGEITSLLYAQVMIQNLKLQWEEIKFIWNLLILVVAMIMYFLLNEEETQQKLIDEVLSISDNPSIEQENDDRKQKQINGIFHLLKLVFLKFVNLFKETQVGLLVTSFGLVQSNFCVVTEWMPYFYTVTNNTEYSLIPILAIIVSISLGPIALQAFLYSILNLERYEKKISYFLCFLGILGFSWILMRYNDGVRLQIVLMSVSHLLIGSPYSRLSTTEIIEEGREDERRTESIFLLGHLMRNTILSIQFIIIGYMMKASSSNFWNVTIGGYLLWFIVETIRNFVRKDQKIHEQI